MLQLIWLDGKEIFHLPKSVKMRRKIARDLEIVELWQSMLDCAKMNFGKDLCWKAYQRPLKTLSSGWSIEKESDKK